MSKDKSQYSTKQLLTTFDSVSKNAIIVLRCCSLKYTLH